MMTSALTLYDRPDGYRLDAVTDSVSPTLIEYDDADRLPLRTGVGVGVGAGLGVLVAVGTGVDGLSQPE